MTSLHSTKSTEDSDVLLNVNLNHVEGIQSISSNYSTFLLDMWGVMHDGTKPYDGVIETVQKLKSQKKEMIILSNSSKRVDNAKRMLTKLGFDPENDFSQIITSGDISHRMLSGDESLSCSTWDTLSSLIQQNKRNVFVFGSGDGDEEYCTSSGWTLSSIHDADLIISRGTFTINDGSGNIVTKKENEEEYNRVFNEALKIAAGKNVPMLVTNPDKVRPDKDLSPMPGAIGDTYEQVLVGGGDGNGDGEYDCNAAQALVKRIGKPYPEVYELALMNCEDPSKAIMVGDALETDVTGGTRSKCATAWVINDGIHSQSVKEFGGDDFEKGAEHVLKKFNEMKGYTTENSLCPTYVTKHFRW